MMATTGFWPVRSSLGTVIRYADNPDKTTNPKYLDDDLAQVLRYAENDDKTDQRLFVTGIHCTAEHALEDMTAVQRRFGLKGQIVAYHGYQSFKTGEVTPEEAHRIGIETAKEMWGDRFQVLVTTHLNTKTVHNHMVVNAVSYKDGKKFQNHIRDHIRLREISDRICRERQLSVLEDAPFFGGKSRGAFWTERSGKLTHRAMLFRDLEDSMQYAMRYKDLIAHLRGKGYEYDWQRHTIKAPDWKRGIRIDRLGFTFEAIEEKLVANLYDDYAFWNWNNNLPYRPKQFPMLELEKKLDYEIEHSDDTVTVLVDVVFFIILQMVKLTRAEQEGEVSFRPLSPSMRLEAQRLDQLDAAIRLMAENNLHTPEDLSQFIAKTDGKIKELEHERQLCRNQLRRPKPKEVEEETKRKIAATTDQLAPLREALNTARRIEETWRRYYEMIKTEREMERKALQRERNRSL